MKTWQMKLVSSLLLLLALLPAAHANKLIMVRIDNNFKNAMDFVQAAVQEQGYRITRVQRVDKGLNSTGHKTDFYRVVFFGKPEEVTRLAKQYPGLAPFLPLKIVVFAEEKDTLVLAHDYTLLKAEFPSELHPTIERWGADMREILETAQLTGVR